MWISPLGVPDWNSFRMNIDDWSRTNLLAGDNDRAGRFVLVLLLLAWEVGCCCWTLFKFIFCHRRNEKTACEINNKSLRKSGPIDATELITGSKLKPFSSHWHVGMGCWCSLCRETLILIFWRKSYSAATSVASLSICSYSWADLAIFCFIISGVSSSGNNFDVLLFRSKMVIISVKRRLFSSCNIFTSSSATLIDFIIRLSCSCTCFRFWIANANLLVPWFFIFKSSSFSSRCASKFLLMIILIHFAITYTGNIQWSAESI